MVCRCLLNHRPNLGSTVLLAWKYTLLSIASGSEERSYYYKNKVECFKKNFSSSNNNGYSQPSVADLHKQWLSRFNTNGVPEPETSIRYIIEHVLGINKTYEYDLKQKEKVTEDQEKQINNLCECRIARMPVQYIIKEWDFRDLKLEMCPPVFIPRPETEQLIDIITELVPPNASFLEIGCGSGAISLSLLKALPQAHVIAVDQSRMACQLTKRNAQLNNIMTNLQVIHSKLKEDGSLSEPLPHVQIDVLVSNPPYVPTRQMLDLQPEIKLYEDLRALEGGQDGLRVVKSLFVLAEKVLKPGGRIFMEVDSSHPTLIEKWLASHPEIRIKFIKTYQDYCDKDRFVELAI